MYPARRKRHPVLFAGTGAGCAQSLLLSWACKSLGELASLEFWSARGLIAFNLCFQGYVGKVGRPKPICLLLILLGSILLYLFAHRCMFFPVDR